MDIVKYLVITKEESLHIQNLTFAFNQPKEDLETIKAESLANSIASLRRDWIKTKNHC